jgi:ABC-type transport system involved in Fe-S cluster assembly fused permease/ATPase subunit
VVKRIQKIYLKSNSQFSVKIKDWAETKAVEIEFTEGDNQLFLQNLDSLLIFNENQSFSSEIQEIKTYFDKQQKSVHKIDINGTLAAGSSNFSLWLENTNCKQLLILGGDELTANSNLERYLTAL